VAKDPVAAKTTLDRYSATVLPLAYDAATISRLSASGQLRLRRPAHAARTKPVAAILAPMRCLAINARRSTTMKDGTRRRSPEGYAAMRRVPQEGQKPRHLQLKATTASWN
jgi:hypothetical protein